MIETSTLLVFAVTDNIRAVYEVSFVHLIMFMVLMYFKEYQRLR